MSNQIKGASLDTLKSYLFLDDANAKSASGFFVHRETNDLIYCVIEAGRAYPHQLSNAATDRKQVSPASEFLSSVYLIDIHDSTWQHHNPIKRDREGVFTAVNISVVSFPPTNTIRYKHTKEALTGIFENSLGYRYLFIDGLLNDYDCMSYSKCKRYLTDPLIDHYGDVFGQNNHCWVAPKQDKIKKDNSNIKTSSSYEKYVPTKAAIGYKDLFVLAGNRGFDRLGNKTANASLTLFGLRFGVDAVLSSGQLDIEFNFNKKGSDL